MSTHRTADSVAPVRKVTAVQFGVFGPDEVKRASAPFPYTTLDTVQLRRGPQI